jgi:hypothetical protein
MEIKDSRGASSKTNKNYEIISRQITADDKEKKYHDWLQQTIFNKLGRSGI